RDQHQKNTRKRVESEKKYRRNHRNDKHHNKRQNDIHERMVLESHQHVAAGHSGERHRCAADKYIHDLEMGPFGPVKVLVRIDHIERYCKPHAVCQSEDENCDGHYEKYASFIVSLQLLSLHKKRNTDIPSLQCPAPLRPNGGKYPSVSCTGPPDSLR